jgi:D-3-phosphoglycerate dehydrogenase
VLCYDIKEHVGDANAKQVSLKELQADADLHIPWTPETNQMVDGLCRCFTKSFCLTSRGIM